MLTTVTSNRQHWPLLIDHQSKENILIAAVLHSNTEPSKDQYYLTSNSSFHNHQQSQYHIISKQGVKLFIKS